MRTPDAFDRDPAAIEAHISRTRDSLDRKLRELERRLSPTHRLAGIRAKLDGAPLAAWGAAAAIAAGSLMAIAGLRRHRLDVRGEGDGAAAAAMDEPVVLISCE